MSNRCRLDQAPTRIADREPFRASEMSGHVIAYPTELPSWGQLPDDELIRLVHDARLARKAGGQTFVVLSFETPIAWTTPDGTVYVPDVHYSSRTTRHQNLARRA